MRHHASLPSPPCVLSPHTRAERRFKAFVENPDYLELKAGWRIRVVVPILRSGGYILPVTPAPEGSSLVSTTSPVAGFNERYRDFSSTIRSPRPIPHP